eukprot:CAMPEP_0170521990 /NCGR_PEP_ID=MMETSP0209-20121228/7423_1 /TAXON_ID=665100 ORGANISM="Litonotus pictus, Strain P1" /NCGR_SAMPLE_ID=MMETSP0209 /ASSEMBLY_ACC=CAM_ASM_000301 /LENGTH=52 /DNA_ID=CAMNT_0010809239 /DNA_START=346 /DNA_END=501 /DNA_ORIENTATION=-
MEFPEDKNIEKVVGGNVNSTDKVGYVGGEYSSKKQGYTLDTVYEETPYGEVN